MKKLFIPLLFVTLLPVSYSCSVGKMAGYVLNERDAEAAIRQLLQIGTQDGVLTGAFSKEMIMTTLFPEPVRKTLNTLNQLGVTNEVDRFTTTLSTAAEKTAANSVPIFVSSISNMRLTDAIRIIKSDGTAATDYLRATTGDSIRRAITPVVQAALEEYKLNEQWNSIIKPIGGSKLNLNLSNLMAGLVSEVMFRKIEEKERQIRTDAAARTTPLLQKVFSRKWD